MHDLLARACGVLSPRAFGQITSARDFDAIEAAPTVRFCGNNDAGNSLPHDKQNHANHGCLAHGSGVNCLAIDSFEGRYLLSGGSDSSVLLWDLHNGYNDGVHIPKARLDRASSSHKYGITHLSFYPFDSLAFLSSSYDHNLKIYSTEKLTASASFDLGSVIYNHAISPIADHLLVATATQHPAVRLVDLRSGAMAHSLAGHQGAVLCTSWSPKQEFILASGGIDGTARIWDIRRSAGSLGVLDVEDAVGMGGEDGFGHMARNPHHGKAHAGPCNGIVWKDDGRYIITAGLDGRVRVWDAELGADVLSHFGPTIKNTTLSTLLPLLVPDMLGSSDQDATMVYPNEKEILVFDLFEGTLLKRLRIPAQLRPMHGGDVAQLNKRDRVTSLAWRSGDVEFYSAHTDGLIRAWKPQSESDAELNPMPDVVVDDEVDPERKRKRQALDEMFRDLSRQKVTFT